MATIHSTTTTTYSSSSYSSSSSSSSTTPIPYRSSRWPARLLVWTGIGHNLVGAFVIPEIGGNFMDAIKHGYVNQFEKNFPRCNALWFMIVGVNLILLGRAVDWYLFPEDKEQAPRAVLTEGKEKEKSQKEQKKRNLVRSGRVVPRELGYWCLGLGVVGIAALPKSGFYLMLFQGAAILLAK
ncbi:hypothetical protein EC957_010557 [Mortierella hygrophila]|uniref:Uncharacterized protein n=1 Tax=Mortierella hygrophila TaxID=979708 RepID=A0A9P6F9N0_9FUNG|nr:hypothetical protein EC957_010557 [Mortierella hygrophila]